MNDAQGLHELGRRSCLVYVALGARSNRLQDGFIVHAGAGDNDAEIGPDGFEAGHDVEQILATAIAEQDQIDVGKLPEFGQRGRDQFQIWLGIKEGPESHKPQRIALHYGDTN